MKQPLDNLVIVGVGLLGGSLAQAALARGLARNVIGVEPCPERRRRLHELRLLTDAAAEIEPAARVADLIVVCTPVDHVAAQVLAAARVCRPGTLITDVGSTKAGIVRAVEADLPREAAFVGSPTGNHFQRNACPGGQLGIRQEWRQRRNCVLIAINSEPSARRHSSSPDQGSLRWMRSAAARKSELSMGGKIDRMDLPTASFADQPSIVSAARFQY